MTLDAPKTAAKLNEKVSLTGHAMNYTGAAVDGAEVKYRVVREVRMPWWWGWWRGGWPQSQSQEIAHGTARTGTDGSFKIEFTAKPDPKVPEKDEPTFVFQINADVTDSAGETRSADRAIRVGYTALEAMISADDWQTDDKPVELKLETKTLDGEPQVAEGSVKIYELQPPEKVHRRAAGRRTVALLADAVRRCDSPDEAPDLSNPNNWPLGKVVAENAASPRTRTARRSCRSRWRRGRIGRCWRRRIVLARQVTGKLPLQVLQAGRREAGDQDSAICWPRRIGRRSRARNSWRCGARVTTTGRAFVEIEQRQQIIQRYWTEPGRTQQQIKLAVTEAMRGGFYAARHAGAREPRLSGIAQSQRAVEEQGTGPEVGALRLEAAAGPEGDVDLDSLKSEVSSRSPELRESKPEKAVAEMVATLYDESLDAFAPQNWPHGSRRVPRGLFDRAAAVREHAMAVSSRSSAAGIRAYEDVEITYRHLPADLTAEFVGLSVHVGSGGAAAA